VGALPSAHTGPDCRGQASQRLACPLPKRCEGDEPESEKADAAIRQVGTNAIPLLLRRMRAHDSPFRARLVALAERTFLIKWPVESEDTQHFQAVRGFTALGPDGRYAVAELMQIYERNNAAKLKLSALKALHNMGPDASEAIPLFLRTLTNSSPPFFRWLAIDALEHMDVQPEILVPVLIKSLSDSNLQVRFTAVERLGKFGPQARAAVPQLLELRARPPAVNRFNGGWILTDAVIDDALIKIDPAAAAKACIQLTNAISSTP
jgi:hypothetical protein